MATTEMCMLRAEDWKRRRSRQDRIRQMEGWWKIDSPVSYAEMAKWKRAESSEIKGRSVDQTGNDRLRESE